ncbi:hypothetical protein GCM10017674_12920 [Streptomyces gardneri]|nr:hypothetical protein GCM10017674_12920 [Streptomyces gardneri]
MTDSVPFRPFAEVLAVRTIPPCCSASYRGAKGTRAASPGRGGAAAEAAGSAADRTAHDRAHNTLRRTAGNAEFRIEVLRFDERRRGRPEKAGRGEGVVRTKWVNARPARKQRSGTL